MNASWTDIPSMVALMIHAAIGMTIILAVGVFVLRIVRRSNPTVRHSVALNFLVACLFVPAISTIYHYKLIQFAPSVSTERSEPVARQAIGIAAPIPPEAESFGGQQTIQRTWFQLIAKCLAAVWLLGTCFIAMAWLLNLRRQHQYLMRLDAVDDSDILARLERLRRAMGIKRRVLLLASRRTPWPFTVGIFRPQVIVPAGLLLDDKPQQIEAVLAHELAHVARCDVGVAMFEGVMRGLCWWNPFVYSVSAALSAAREVICDSFVLKCGGDGESLANYLVVSLEQIANERLAWGVGMSANDPEHVDLRINQLISGDNHKMKYLSKLAHGLILSCALVLCLACVHTNYAQAEFILGEPVNFGPIVNSVNGEASPVMPDDGLSLYFHSGPDTHIWMSTRSSIDADWTPPVISVFNAANPFISGDDLTFMYASGSPGMIYQHTRSSPTDPWGPQEKLPSPINSEFAQRSVFQTADELTLLFEAERPDGEGSSDIWEATRTALGEAWTVRSLGDRVNTPSHEGSPSLSSDGLMLIFSSTRPGGEGSHDIWMSRRALIGNDWGEPTNLGPTVNTAGRERPSQLWEPGNLLLFKAGGNGRGGPSDPPDSFPGFGSSDLFYVTVVPEPSTAALACSGALLLMGFVRRRRSRPCPKTGGSSAPLTSREPSQTN